MSDSDSSSFIGSGSGSSSEENPVAVRPKFALSLGAMHRASGPSYHEAASDFASVDVVLLCPQGLYRNLFIVHFVLVLGRMSFGVHKVCPDNTFIHWRMFATIEGYESSV